jgi:hypothetical protein
MSFRSTLAGRSARETTSASDLEISIPASPSETLLQQTHKSAGGIAGIPFWAIGVAIGGLVLIIAIIAAILIRRYRKKQRRPRNRSLGTAGGHGGKDPSDPNFYEGGEAGESPPAPGPPAAQPDDEYTYEEYSEDAVF